MGKAVKLTVIDNEYCDRITDHKPAHNPTAAKNRL